MSSFTNLKANIDGKEIALTDWLLLESYKLDEGQENERLDYCKNALDEYIVNTSEEYENQSNLYIPHPYIAQLCLNVLTDTIREVK